jgi:methionyl-tRNA synthetase
VLSADCYARYSKLRDRPTLFVCGTDEYGTATETRAQELKVSPRELCDEFAAKHKAIYDWFELGFDTFGRTSTEKHTEIVQDIFLKLKEKGYIAEDSTDQPKCKEHGYLADRFVEGTCPVCSYKGEFPVRPVHESHNAGLQRSDKTCCRRKG